VIKIEENKKLFEEDGKKEKTLWDLIMEYLRTKESSEKKRLIEAI